MERFTRRQCLQYLGVLGAGLVLGAAPHGISEPKSIISPEEVSVSTPTPVLDKPQQANLFDQLMEPLVKDAQKKRFLRKQSDLDRIDSILNQNRLNFLIYSYGETHEPPLTEWAKLGSFTVFSYDSRQRKIDLVSLTHDIRAPEIERFKAFGGERGVKAHKMYHAYDTGGFDLTRKVLEGATGLSIDFQIAFADTVIVDFVDSSFERVDVDVPADFVVYPFYLNGEKYPRGEFKKGREEMDGKRVVQFIKTVPIDNEAPVLEHNARKHLVFKALLQSVKQNTRNPLFWMKTAFFLRDSESKGTIAYDFDAPRLIINNIWEIAKNIGNLRVDGGLEPEFGKTVYIVDPNSGDGGVQWITANTAHNPHTQKDFEDGIYPDPAVEVPYNEQFPFNANPNAVDLVNQYWLPTRLRVKSLLLG